MLQKLVIRNYAIIDHLAIEPDKHLNIVTGETGAGKSIILGALSLILGERADTSVLINKEQKCVIEAYFAVQDNKSFLKALKLEELDEDDICIIRREISANGKTRAFVNDTPVTLNLLNRLTSLLVDLHQQFGHLALSNDHFQTNIVDAIGNNGDLIRSYGSSYKQYTEICQKLSELRTRQADWQKTADYKQFLFDELVQADFKPNEIEEAEQQLKQLTHAERIISVLQSSGRSLNQGEQPVVPEIRRVIQQLQSVADVMNEVQFLHERLNSTYEELKDIASELENIEQKVNIDPRLMEELQVRQDLGYKLFKKHGVNTTAKLLEIQLQLKGELQETLNLNGEIQSLSMEKDEIHKTLISEASKLSAQRKKTAPDVAKKVTHLLHLVGMPNAQFRIEVLPLEQPHSHGMDQIQFLLDANKSSQFLPVYKAASGGEMSRIMLCIKSLTAKAMDLPTLVFDEVDTGISGEAAKQVGSLLHQLGQAHQVICITHQPQVAAKGSRHFYVYKELVNKHIYTKVRLLDQNERVVAIAQMIDGEKPGEAALQHAKEMVSV